VTEPTTAARPALSVVVVPFAGGDALARALAALDAQTGLDAPPEIVIPYDPADAASQPVAAAAAGRSNVVLVRTAGDGSPHRLRAAGCAAARGRIIAVTEDHCTPQPEWAARLLVAHRSHGALADGATPPSGVVVAVGGAVDKVGDDRAMGWAVYLSDYSRYMPPLPAGDAQYLTDCNVSYRREALEAVRDAWADEFIETTVHGALRARGWRLWLDPSAVVRQQRAPALGGVIRERFDHGRVFARERVATAPAVRRLIFAGASVALPAVLLARTAQRASRRGDVARKFVGALPALALMQLAWSAGEIAGYLGGGRRAPDPSRP
jgi:glycosyl transferase family 2